MIKAVRCDQKSFKTVLFDSGFNIVLAERTKNSSQKDSRNGLGKTMLIEIINFCLGSSVAPGAGIRSKELEGWTFMLDLTLKGKDYTVSRNTADSSRVWLKGDFSDWLIQPESDSNGKYFMKIREWCRMLGVLMFGLSKETTEKPYSPTFRSLISYFARRGVEGFNNPFKHYNQQFEWDKQVQNAYLLGLNWEYASEFQLLKDKRKILDNLKLASETGLLANFIGSIGTLEAEEVALKEEISEFERQIGNFKVHPQYYDIQKQADQLTEEIHRLINQRTINSAILKSYQESIKEERDVSEVEVVQIYKEAGLFFPLATEKKIKDVLDFHTQVIRNRRTYLKSEIEKVSQDINKEELMIETLSDQRAVLLETLRTHGALNEYSKLQQKLNQLKQKKGDIRTKIDNLKTFEQGIEKLEIEKKELLQKARQDKEERRRIIENAIKLFNQNSKALYDEPGALSIDIGQNGYKFGVEIKRARSQGIGYMKVFCYDLALIQIRSYVGPDMPGFLIHDSTIFDGVDERQIAKALELAAREAESKNFQYICTINSDMIPKRDFTAEFLKKFNSYIKLVLSDASENGGLLGIRF